MKLIIKPTLVILFLSICTTINAQTRISLEEAGSYADRGKPVPESVLEINDFNNILPSYLGVWKGYYDDKSIEIAVYYERISGGYINLTEDQISFTYKIKDLNGNILVSSESSGLGDAFGLGYSPQSESYNLYLQDACRNNKTIFLTSYSEQVLDAGDVQKMKFIVGPDLMGGTYSSDNNLSNCSSVADLLPNGNIVNLTKQ
jgi:hypothetical protein